MRENREKPTSQSAAVSKRQNYDFYQTIKDDDLKFLLEKTNDEVMIKRNSSLIRN